MSSPLNVFARAVALVSVGLAFVTPAAAAITFSFTDGLNGANGKYNQTASNMYSPTVDGLTVNIFAGLYETDGTVSTDTDCADGSCSLSKRILRKANNGLGTRGWTDWNADIDGNFGNDLMSFVFDVPVILKGVIFRKVESHDRADIFVDGALVQDEVDIAGGTPFSLGDPTGTSFGFGADDATDGFRIGGLVVERVTGTVDSVAPVPLPAAGVLLLGALGGLGVATRRRRAGA